jgi:F-type H+-transporting ATPase subunit c
MKLAKTIALAFALLALTTATASAQGTAPVANAPFSQLRELAVGLVIIGAAMGIGGIAKSAVESQARQPEIAGTIQISMIIAAALIEGATFFALIVIGFAK